MAETVKYSEMSDDDLKSRLIQLKDEFYSARQKTRMGQFKKFSEFKRLRKDIARAKTVLRARELGAETPKAKPVKAPKAPKAAKTAKKTTKKTKD